MTTPVQQAGYHIGQKFKIVSKRGIGSDFRVGNTITLLEDDGTDAPKFYRGEDTDDTQYISLSDIEVYSRPTNATEAGLLVGKQYRVKAGNDDGYPAGTIVRFIEDDRSSCPKFEVPESVDADGWNYMYVYDIDPNPVGDTVSKQAATPVEVAAVPGFMVETSESHTLFRVNRQLSVDEVKRVLDIIGG